MNINIIPYEKKYNERIRQMEKGIVQGKSIQLEIIKDNFLGRATVFRKYHALLATGPNDTPVATSIGARTKIGVNGVTFDAGYGFETKVSPEIRNNGVGKLMATSLYTKFFHPEGLTKVFTTLKQNNIPIVRLLKKAIPGMWLYEFVYLTIPCNARLSKKLIHTGEKQLLTVNLFGKDEIDSSFICNKPSGLAYFNTFKMYQLKIGHLNRLWKLAFWLHRKISPGRYGMLPAVGDIVKFATLFNHTPGNVSEVNEILDDLSKKGVHFLTVCCRRNDSIFKALKQLSINTYDYYMVTDFPLAEKDEVTLDVRCL